MHYWVGAVAGGEGLLTAGGGELEGAGIWLDPDPAGWLGPRIRKAATRMKMMTTRAPMKPFFFIIFTPWLM
jgi:hypothetical protein